MRSLQQYRLFVTLFILPILVIVGVVVAITFVAGGDEGEPAETVGGTAQTTAGTGLPGTTVSSQAPIVTMPAIATAPTQTPVPEPTPIDQPTPTVSPTPTMPPVDTPTPEPEGPIEYAVQDGDTLFTIAVEFGVSVQDLVEFNELPDENFVFVGQVLEIPTDPSQIIERRESRPIPTTAVVIPVEGLNVRDEANTETSTVQYVAGGGSELALTGVKKKIDGVEWWELDDGNWTQGQYLEIGVKAAPTEAPTETPAPEAGTTPAGDATTTPAGDATTTPAVAGDTVTAVVVPDAGLNVRELADPNATVAYVAPGASTIELTSETVVVNGVTWWQVYDGNWVQGQFLKFG